MTTATTGPVRKPDGTGRIHLRHTSPDGDTLACGIWGAWQYQPVPAADVRDDERCRRCWPSSEPASGSGAGE